MFKAGFQELVASDDDVHEPEDYHELNQFLLKEGWIKHVSGFCASELSLLTNFPKEDDLLKPIARAVNAIMSNIQVAIRAVGYHVRHLLGKRPA